MDSVIVIGGGHAGAEAVVALRANGWKGKILLICDESYFPYQRPPLSKSYLLDGTSDEKLLIKKEAIYKKLDVDVRLNTSVNTIDVNTKTVYLSNNTKELYSSIIVATGTSPRKLDLPGSDATNIHYLRTITDVKKIKDKLKENTRFLIVGAGYIGLEVAASVTKSGGTAIVLEAQDRVLSRVTSTAMSKFYQEYHEKNGVHIKLNAKLERLEHKKEFSLAYLQDGTSIEFEHAIVGIGVLPNQGIAEKAGIFCDNGIVVDAQTKTSVQDIYAIGDVSCHPSSIYNRNVRLESVPNAMEQAKVAAANICGVYKTYNSLPWFWSDQFDIKLQTAGLSQGYDEAILRGKMEDNQFSVFYLLKKRLIAVDAINSPKDFMKAKQLIPNDIKLLPSKISDLDSDWY